jgi:hypothetical protein
MNVSQQDLEWIHKATLMNDKYNIDIDNNDIWLEEFNKEENKWTPIYKFKACGHEFAFLILKYKENFKDIVKIK